MKIRKYKGWFAVMALSMFLVSCDRHKDLPEASGKLIPVSIGSLTVAAGGEETEVRSAGPRGGETFSTSIGGGMLLEMRVELEESPLRLVGDGDRYSLAENARFRVIALLYDGVDNDTYVSHGDFTFTTGPTMFYSDEPFLIREGSQYNFVCISYNNGNLPDDDDYVRGQPLPALDVDNSEVNLLWWKSDAPSAVIDSEENTYLSILLKRRLARVQVVLDCTYNGWTITGFDAMKDITMGSDVVNGTLNLVTGAMTGVSGDQAITWPSTADAMQRTSNVFYVIPKSVSVTVPTEAITVTGNVNHTKIPSAEGTGMFSMALVSAGNYKLYVKLRTPIWAKSNIYWDTDKLTFVAATGNTDKEGYQGVFFKWGSLVGISPAQTEVEGVMEDEFSGATPVYIPNYVAGGSSTWIPSTTHSYTAAGWPTTTSNVAEDAAENIPYLDGRAAFQPAAYGRGNAFVIEVDRNSDVMYGNKRGDICQYLGATGAGPNGYRLPASNEFGTGFSYWNNGNPTTVPVGGGWVRGATFPSQPINDAGNAAGTVNLITDKEGFGLIVNQMMGNLTLPASGYRREGGLLGFVGTCGGYWSGSASNVDKGHELLYYSSFVGVNYDILRNYAYPVRCVKN
jgi:hypothetical protein